jgi:hypothetical protein
MVVAEPVVFASEIIQTTDLITEAGLDDSLFADVEAPLLAAFEAEQVEGDGAILGAAVGYVLARVNAPQRLEAYVYSAQMAHGGYSQARAQANAYSFAAIVCIGAVALATAFPYF